MSQLREVFSAGLRGDGPQSRGNKAANGGKCSLEFGLTGTHLLHLALDAELLKPSQDERDSRDHPLNNVKGPVFHNRAKRRAATCYYSIFPAFRYLVAVWPAT